MLCVVPGPGVTNALTMMGEALLDSIPLVCIVGDIARGDKYRPFQIHGLPNIGLLQNVCKEVNDVRSVDAIPLAVRNAFRIARAGEPGPVSVVVPYNLLTVSHRFNSGPLAPVPIPVDDAGSQRALALLSDHRLCVGIYAGLGCMDFSHALVRAAEILQAPVATSLSGKGVIPEDHPLSVGWGYGGQGTAAAEEAFKHVDVVLAIGVRFSEVSTGFYGLPQHRHLIHVDINPENLGRIMRTTVCVNEDAGFFLSRVAQQTPQLARPANQRLHDFIRTRKMADFRKYNDIFARTGCDPMAFLLALRRCTNTDAMVFLDATVSQFWAAEAFTATGPRTWFLPANNQAMGWSIGAALRRPARLPLPANRDHHRRRLFPDVGHGDFDRGARGAAGQVLRARRSGLSFHAGIAAAGLFADHGHDPCPPRLRCLGSGIGRGLSGNHQHRQSRCLHPRRCCSQRASPDPRGHRLSQSAHSLGGGDEAALHR